MCCTIDTLNRRRILTAGIGRPPEPLSIRTGRKLGIFVRSPEKYLLIPYHRFHNNRSNAKQPLLFQIYLYLYTRILLNIISQLLLKAFSTYRKSNNIIVHDTCMINVVPINIMANVYYTYIFF